jgi:hypothetical protein
MATVFGLLLLAAPVWAQMQSRPTDAPTTTAASESWYRLREPLSFSGELYYPAGAAVFFNGNVMVRTGHYNGVPLYVDATLEPYSIVYVPIGRGQMQPYERPRTGSLAGTAGSRPSSFPSALTPQTPGRPQPAVRQAPAAYPALPLTGGAMSVYTPETTALPVAPAFAPAQAVAVAARPEPVVAPAPVPPPSGAISTVVPPRSNVGLWVRFEDRQWASNGRAVPRAEWLEEVGKIGTVPVYRDRAVPDVIYLPTRDGVVAPYRRRS